VKKTLILIFVMICFQVKGVSFTRIVALDSKSNLSVGESPTIDTLSTSIIIHVDSFNLPIIYPSEGVQFYKNGIIFLNDSKNETKMLPDHVSFGALDLYYAPLRNAKLGKHVHFSKQYPFPFPANATTFSQNYQTMYFSRYVNPLNKLEGTRIFRATFQAYKLVRKSDWSPDYKALLFCSGNYNYTQPAISQDGKVLVFAADIPISRGGLDLFFVKPDKSGWTDPLGLGSLINTQYDEQYPFLDSYGNLFFSSNKPGGYGGYDVYLSRFNGKGWNSPVNLGAKVNSENDEISFKVSRDDESFAFFVSGQKSSLRKFQLFTAILSNQFIDQENISGPMVKKPAKQLTKTSQKNVKSSTKLPVVKKFSAKPKPSSQPIVAPQTKKPIAITEPIVFRVQIISSSKSKGAFSVTISNQKYSAFEYYYKGAFRYTVGAFDSVSKASQFRLECRKAGYTQAFVAAFKGKVRVTDPSVFKR